MKLLIIDWDQSETNWLGERLKNHGFAPTTLATPEQALRTPMSRNAAAIVVEMPLGHYSASAVTRHLRKAGLDQPLVVLTASDSWRDTIDAFDAGADDYIAKPVRSEVIAARLRAIIRRSCGNSTDRIVLGDLEFDLRARCAWRAGICLDLTRNEFRLLRLLLQSPGQVLTPREIHVQLYPTRGEFSQNAIEVQIARLRRKVGKEYIRTVRGVGYRYAVDSAHGVTPPIEREACLSTNGGWQAMGEFAAETRLAQRAN